MRIFKQFLEEPFDLPLEEILENVVYKTCDETSTQTFPRYYLMEILKDILKSKKKRLTEFQKEYLVEQENFLLVCIGEFHGKFFELYQIINSHVIYA